MLKRSRSLSEKSRILLAGSWRIGFCLRMSKRYRPWKFDEPMLLPATVQEFVDKDHLARLVLNLVVEEIDLQEIERVYRVDARAAAVRSSDDDGAPALRLLQRGLFVAADREGLS